MFLLRTNDVCSEFQILINIKHVFFIDSSGNWYYLVPYLLDYAIMANQLNSKQRRGCDQLLTGPQVNPLSGPTTTLIWLYNSPIMAYL